MIVILVTAVAAPMGVMFNTKMYLAGQDIILRTNNSISQIQNETVRNTLSNTFGSSLDNVENNIEINNGIFKYGWVFVVILAGLVLFLFTRQLVEVNQGGLT